MKALNQFEILNSKAETDYRVCQILKNHNEIEAVAFHAQQYLEKKMKAFLALNEEPFEKIHDLNRLNQKCIEI
ncbi:MAG: HEPN domain-containing protein, partial [Fusobacteria bacterium]|nr:HEPN domain-containing protein [Fusobacteriota bacterium]